MYHLIDCIDLNQKHPLTFNLPDDVQIAKLKVGDSVKVFFQYSENYPTPQGVDINSERLWVDITKIENSQLSGTIANDPVNPHLKFGNIVDFEAKHICNVQYL